MNTSVNYIKQRDANQDASDNIISVESSHFQGKNSNLESLFSQFIDNLQMYLKLPYLHIHLGRCRFCSNKDTMFIYSFRFHV